VTDPEVPFANYQNEIYLRGMSGQRPLRPVGWAELERRAEAALASGPRGYIWGAAGTGDTLRANLDAFRRWRIVPRMLHDVSQRSLARTVLGTEMPAPLLTAPVGVQTLAHPEGELASARAAAELGVPVVVSSAASHSFEQIAEASGAGPRWFQLYWPRDRELAASFLSRAGATGARAVVVTLDTWLLGWRPADLGEAFLPFLWGEGAVNYLQDPVFRGMLAKTPEEDMQTAIATFLWQFANPSVTWDDLAFLRERTSLPIVLKGILNPDDARLAIEHGVDGIIVSNHGGRQVDGAIAALDALPPVVQAVAGACEVLFDSGIRSGADAFKALALGARAVLLGRPFMWGLTLGGRQGVVDVLRAFLAELDLTMALSGCATVDEVGPEAVVAAAGG
jgi:lactate 2-monooxygenase